MTDTYDPVVDYMQVRRVIARISLSNEHLSKEERVVLASSIGGAAGLSHDQIQVLIKDTSNMPELGVLMENLSHPAQYRQLLVDLAALAVIKRDWDKSELSSVDEVVVALPFDDATRAALKDVFETLRKASHSLG